MPAERKYKTAAALRRAIDKYLRSIRTLRRTRELNVDGKPIEYEAYIVPPELGDIVHVLGVSRQTWSRWSRGDLGADYAQVCEDAKNECERYLRRELITRTKAIDGIKFDLQCNYGWKSEKAEDTSGTDVTVIIEGDDDYSG